MVPKHCFSCPQFVEEGRKEALARPQLVRNSSQSSQAGLSEEAARRHALTALRKMPLRGESGIRTTWK